MSSRFGDQIFRADSARASVMDWINHKNRTCATPVLVPDQKFAWLVSPVATYQAFTSEFPNRPSWLVYVSR